MINKNLIVIFIFLITGAGSCIGTKQHYFNGHITYAYTYETERLNFDSLSRLKPEKGFFRFDQNNYQSRFAGKDTVTYYYSGALNKCLSKLRGSGKMECEDYSMETDSVTSWKLYSTEEKILGLDCDIIEIENSKSSVKYFVSKELRIAPGTYQNHKAYNWGFYASKANGGLILKIEHRFADFIMHGIATEVKNEAADFKALEIDEKKFMEICRK